MNFSIGYGMGWLGGFLVVAAVPLAVFVVFTFLSSVRGARNDVLGKGDDGDHGIVEVHAPGDDPR